MKLVILGNGFDLHHGYKTSFNDFRNHLLSSNRETDRKLISNVDIILKSENIKIEEGILWNDFERIIGKMIAKSSKIIVEEIKLLNLIENFTENFYHYLIEDLTDNKLIKNEKIFKELQEVDSILTFNYTKHYLSYLNNTDLDVFHIHGELSDENLPIIGYYYQDTYPNSDQTDYLKRYNNKAFHKPSLAYKQNEKNLDENIERFSNKWSKKISEVVFIGYSFGESDSHIYNILNNILLKQNQDINIPLSKAKYEPVIKFKFFNYDSKETNELIEKVKTTLVSKARRRSYINVTGSGFIPKKKNIITFEIIDY